MSNESKYYEFWPSMSFDKRVWVLTNEVWVLTKGVRGLTRYPFYLNVINKMFLLQGVSIVLTLIFHTLKRLLILFIQLFKNAMSLHISLCFITHVTGIDQIINYNVTKTRAQASRTMHVFWIILVINHKNIFV